MNAQMKRKMTRIKVAQQSRCFYCKEYSTLDELTIDHLMPKSMGGNNTHSNLVASCSPCNLRKGNRFGTGLVNVINAIDYGLKNGITREVMMKDFVLA